MSKTSNVKLASPAPEQSAIAVALNSAGLTSTGNITHSKMEPIQPAPVNNGAIASESLAILGTLFAEYDKYETMGGALLLGLVAFLQTKTPEQIAAALDAKYAKTAGYMYAAAWDNASADHIAALARLDAARIVADAAFAAAADKAPDSPEACKAGETAKARVICEDAANASAPLLSRTESVKGYNRIMDLRTISAGLKAQIDFGQCALIGGGFQVIMDCVRQRTRAARLDQDVADARAEARIQTMLTKGATPQDVVAAEEKAASDLIASAAPVKREPTLTDTLGKLTKAIDKAFASLNASDTERLFNALILHLNNK
jgi:hypothetical protein